jgi:hypothetical protein
MKKSQRGAALVVGLVLLVVVTVLAISGVNTATTELAMARNDQNYEYAFQAAETGLEQAVAQVQFNTTQSATVSQRINDNDTVTAVIRFEGSTIVPDRAFSLGIGGGISAHHFSATANAQSRRSTAGTSDRDTTAEHAQGFYVVGPEFSAIQ